MKRYTFLFFLLIMLHSFVHGQIQLGMDIFGEAADDESGESISMPNSTTIAIGAIGNSDGGEDAGHVRVYEWDGNDWVQKGADLDGANAEDAFGVSVSMPDANTLAVGASGDDTVADVSGLAKVYEWKDGAWVQKGNTLYGMSLIDRFGIRVNMPDANTLAVTATEGDIELYGSGRVAIYDWDGTSWVQRGDVIQGERDLEFLGAALSMPDANTIALGTAYNDDGGEDSGDIKVYIWNGIDWVLKGNKITGVAADDNFGWSISMPDPNTVAAGARHNDGNGSDAGHVRIFNWNGTSWDQVGQDLEGDEVNDNFGYSVSMPNSQTVAVGAIQHDGDNILNSGQVKVFELNGGEWVLKGIPMNGESLFENFGWSVSMPDANTVGIGGPENAESAPDAGHVKVFQFETVSVVENSHDAISMFPNPTFENVNFDFGVIVDRAVVVLRDITGKVVQRSVFINEEKISIEIMAPNGLYFAEVIVDDVVKEVFRIVKL